jgi:dTDP-4-dehydrorhamnose reductase
MKILLFGANGQVGWELQRSLAPLGEVLAPRRDDAQLPADFARPEELAAAVRAVRPALIVNAAAHTAVDRAESEPELAMAINATAPGVLAREAAAIGALLLHYSTDYVFDGSGQHARTEDEPTHPVNVYGRSKLAGELEIRSSGCRHLILRTSWVYAARGGNFARTMLRLAGARDELRVVDDQFGAPTGAELIADLSAHAAWRALREPSLCGTYHAVAGGQTSWHGYACEVIEWARAQGLPVKVRREAIAAVSSAEFASPAARPMNSRLATHKLRTAFGLELPDWRVGVRRMLTEVYLKDAQ